MTDQLSEVKVAQFCLTLYNHMDCSLPGSSVHGIFQARILEWVAVPFSKGSSQSRDQTQVSRIAGRFFTIWAPRKAQWNDTKATERQQWRDLERGQEENIAHLWSCRKKCSCHLPISSAPFLGNGRNPGSGLSWWGERGTIRDGASIFFQLEPGPYYSGA